MGFLDNLESSLNNLERQEERDPSAGQKHEDERKRTLASAPAADRLKNSDWTKRLYDRAAEVGHSIRAKVYVAWIGDTLRLEAKGSRLDLVPGPDGVKAHYVKPDGQPVDELMELAGDPQGLLSKWLIRKD